MEEYNEQQTDPTMRLHDMQCMTFLQEAVRQDEHLHQIQDDDTLRIARGHPPLTYPEYLQLLQSRAGILDSSKPRHTRRVNHTQFSGYDSESDIKDESDNMLTYIVREIQQRKVGHIEGQAWNELSPEIRRMWRTMSEGDRTQFATALCSQINRADGSTPKGERKVKTHDLSNDSDDDEEDNNSNRTAASEDPEGTRIVKQAMKAAQQSKSAGKSKP